MKGEELKEKIRLSGRRFNEVADAMGVREERKFDKESRL